MGQFIPTFFANKIVSDIMIDGKGWFSYKEFMDFGSILRCYLYPCFNLNAA